MAVVNVREVRMTVRQGLVDMRMGMRIAGRLATSFAFEAGNSRHHRESCDVTLVSQSLS